MNYFMSKAAAFSRILFIGVDPKAQVLDLFLHLEGLPVVNAALSLPRKKTPKKHSIIYL